MHDESTSTSRAVTVLLFLIGILGLSAIAPGSWFGSFQTSKKPLDLETIFAAGKSARDTNKDGVITWEELVNETFKNASATLKQIQEKPIDQSVIDNLNDPNNMTASLSKNLFITASLLQEEESIPSSTKQEALVGLLRTEASKMTPTKYTLEDLQLLETETKESKKRYGNTVAPLFKKVLTRESVLAEINSLSSYAESKNTRALETFRKSRDRVDSIIDEMLLVSVPVSASPYHLVAINRLALYRDTLDALSVLDTDPLRGMFVTKDFFATVALVVNTPNQVANYFTVENIVFTPSDPGYIFTTGYTYTK